MDAITATFLGIGGLAVLLMALSLIGGHLHLGHIHLGHIHVGHFHLGQVSGGEQFTLPSIAGFVGAFGFVGAIAATLNRGSGGARVLVAVVAGIVAAVPAAWLAGRFARAALNISTDATLTSANLIGSSGVVLTPIPADGYGEVRITVGGHVLKLNARADQPLERGTEVFVIEVPSPTSVLVVPLHS